VSLLMGRRSKQTEEIFKAKRRDSRIAKTHAVDGRPIELLSQSSNSPRDVLVDIPNLTKKKGMGSMQYNMPEGTGKRHLAKAFKKPLKRRKNKNGS
tara:strand:- start:2644 stop:2931 length:288 start_codon:yes stop_codon:yes gene_type:complete